jgi:glycosyltransferase involved in cell wall biosynthesis
VRVVVDARPTVDPRPTGVGHYARALLRHLPPADPETRYIAWSLAAPVGAPRGGTVDTASNVTERVSRIPASLFGPFSVRVGLPRLEWLVGRFDLVVATNFVPPPTASRGTVLVVHDLAFEVLPETAPHHHARWRRSFERWLGRAAAVILPSEAARADLLRFHGVSPERAVAIHHGIDPDAHSQVPRDRIEHVRDRYGIGGPSILFLGGLEPRKNLEALVRAFGLLRDRPEWLVVAGDQVPWAPGYADRVDRAVRDLPASIRERVIRTGYVGAGDRQALLAGAEILAYPSRYEGFGFPILEGFASRVPVLTSNISSMPEVAGDAALLVDPSDPTAIAQGLERMIDDEALRDRLRDAGDARVARFTWERSMSRTATALHAARERIRG